VLARDFLRVRCWLDSFVVAVGTGAGGSADGAGALLTPTGGPLQVTFLSVLGRFRAILVIFGGDFVVVVAVLVVLVLLWVVVDRCCCW